MPLTDLTRISTSGIATGSTIDAPILRKDVDYRGSQVGVNTILFDSSENSLEFRDGAKATFGDNKDLEIYHSNTNSIINDSGTGNLQLQVGGSTKLETNPFGVVVTGILTATEFSGGVSAGVVTCTGLDVNGNGDVSGNFVVHGDLTVNGTTTTLDTNLTEVDKLEVSANNTTVGAAITQSGSGDILRLYDGTSQVITIDDEGQVGINTTDVSHLLTVFAKTTSSNIARFKAFNGNSNFDIHTDASSHGQAYVRNNVGAIKVALNSNGNSYFTGGKLMVGTTTPGHADADDLTLQADSGWTGLTLRSPANTSGAAIYFSDATSGGGQYDGWITYDQSASRLHFGTAQSEKMRILSDGSVGIGTVTPETNFRLTVQGDLSLGEKSGTSNTYIDQKQDGDLHLINSGRTANGTPSGSLTGGTGGVGINKFNTIAGGTTFFRDFAVYNGKSTKVLAVRGSSSKVGIGTDIPARFLDIRGGTNGNANSRVLRLATADNGKRVDFSYERDGFLSINNGINDEALLLIGQEGDICIDRTGTLANCKLSINQDASQEGIGLQLSQSSGITTAFTFYNSSGTNIGQISLKTDNDPDIVFKVKDSSGSPVEKVKFTSAGNVYQTGSIYSIDSAASAQFILDRANTSSGATVDLRTAGTTKWYFGMRGLVNDNFYIRNESGSTDPFTILPNGNVGINDTSPSFNLEVGGSFAATTKSFIIDHPTKEKHKLRYACLEGPENSVYVRGKTSDSVIELPDYWTGLVHEDSITVNVTPIGNHKVWVESINNNSVTIGSDGSEYFYTVFAERKDVDKLEVEVAE